MTQTLLIDGDIEAYRAACFCEDSIDWDGTGSLEERHRIASFAHACAMVTDSIASYQERLGIPKVIVCLSCVHNWRKTIWDGYKAHRSKPKPLILEELRGWLAKKYPSAEWWGLEADDVMGVMATTLPDAYVIVSIDKDLKTIPGHRFNPRKPEEGVVFTDKDSAFIWHMTQTLTGDSSDGYKGCPGIGPKKAEKIIAAAIAENQVDWRNSVWSAVEQTFVEKGLTAADALLNARLARILQAGDLVETHPRRVLLWQPPSASASVIGSEWVRIHLGGS